MMKLQDLKEYKKNKEYIICIDSDGCAMDTMDIKHIQCFGPCMITEWSLQTWQTDILTRWNEINLYSQTRGINRFKGLAIMLEEINETYCTIEGVEHFKKWTDESVELSNAALTNLMKENKEDIFQKALNWSNSVNEAITMLDEANIIPFEGVLEAIKEIEKVADIAIVSSANEEAVVEEWSKFGLLPHVDILLSQKMGSKAYCIECLLEKGYDASKVLMIGDAPGDQKAAFSNKVSFYPILVKKEEASWKKFQEEILGLFLEGKYSGEYQEIANEEFARNLICS